MNSKEFKFSNLNEIIDNIAYRAKYHHIQITECNVTETYVHIEANKWIASENDVLEFFRHIVNGTICAQNVFKPAFITNHMIKEFYLNVEGNEIEINIIANEEFDLNDYCK